MPIIEIPLALLAPLLAAASDCGHQFTDLELTRLDQAIDGLDVWPKAHPNIPRPTYGERQADALGVARLLLGTMGGGKTDPGVPRLRVDLEPEPEKKPEPVLNKPKKNKRGRGSNGISNKARDATKAKGTATRTAITDILKANQDTEGMTTADVAHLMGRDHSGIVRHLNRLAKDGEVERVGQGRATRWLAQDRKPKLRSVIPNTGTLRGGGVHQM